MSRTSGLAAIRHVKRAAYLTDFYTILGERGEESFELETALSRIESLAATALRRVVTGGLPISQEDKQALALLMAFQVVRVPAMRADMDRFMDHVVKLGLSLASRERVAVKTRLEAAGVEATDELVDEAIRMLEEPNSYTLQAHQNQHLQTMLSAAQAQFPYFMVMSWSLVRSSEYLYLTSDSPVVLWARPREGFYPLGLATADEIYFPLNSEYLLVLRPPGEGDEISVESTPERVLGHNRLQVAYAREWVFAYPTHPHIGALGRLARQDPPRGITIS